MNALAGYGSSSDSDADAPDAAPPAPAAASTPTARHDDGSSPAPAAAPTPMARHDEGLLGESESEDEAEAAAPAAVSTSGLPSAVSLLDGGGTASWLDKPAWAAAPREPDPVPARPSAAVAARATAAAGAAREAQEGEYGHDMYERYDPARGWVGKQASNIEHDDMRGYGRHLAAAGRRPPPQQRAPPPPPPPRPAAKRGSGDRSAKPTGKERVKQQRLNGQSGIGDHFRVWRSEEEMRMRQTYD